MPERYVCIHGHFYQPPRESPWLEAIEPQDSAHPYHDWNERITAECYAPNAAARILDAEDRIRSIVNNYAKISFDVGPTLMRWLATGAPEVYAAILEADRTSCAAHAGHGSAVGHAYNHPILPLCDARDRRTQLAWGLRDFEQRFGRRAEGLWLPETAVDLATLEALADSGLRFTILAPEQAHRVRRSGEPAWRAADGGNLDTTRPYTVRLPSGRDFALFFFHGPLAREVAFHRLLDRGEGLARRLLGIFDPSTDRPQLAHFATDGETFGHHHRFGDMALAWALDHLESRHLASPTNYAAFLDLCPPIDEVEIRENTSWSCAHGIERWRADCGCGSGRPGWNQAWRLVLRAALDHLRDDLARAFERSATGLLRDPWEARDGYIEILLDRSGPSRERFLARHARGVLSADRRVATWKLLEMQRHALLMFTSCGWFFDDITRIETVQNLRHAARAIQLCREVTGEDLEPALLERLAEARSNVPELGDGRRVYLEQVAPARVDLAQVAGHHAASLLFEARPTRSRVYGFEAEPLAWTVDERGPGRLGLGRFRISSSVTEESADLSLAVLHHGGYELTGGARPFAGQADHDALIDDLQAAWTAADPAAAARCIEREFPEHAFSFHTLFRDEQRRILHTILGAKLEQASAALRGLHQEQEQAMRLLGELGVPAPAAFRAAADFALNDEVKTACASDPLDVLQLERLVEESRRENVPLDRAALSLALQQALERAVQRLRDDEGNLQRIEALDLAVRLARTFAASLWRVENGFWELVQTRYPSWRERAAAGDPAARSWITAMEQLSRTLRVAWPMAPAGAERASRGRAR